MINHGVTMTERLKRLQEKGATAFTQTTDIASNRPLARFSKARLSRLSITRHTNDDSTTNCMSELLSFLRSAVATQGIFSFFF